MLAARVANRSAKPNGHRFVSTSELLEFFKAVAVKHLPGMDNEQVRTVVFEY